MKSLHPLVLPIGVAVAVRMAVFIFLIYYPIHNDFGFPISPLIKQKAGDIIFYEQFRQRYFESVSPVFEGVFTDSIDMSNLSLENVPWVKYWISVPLFPYLLHFFNYADGHTLPIAFFYLAMSIALVSLWQYWLYCKGVNRLWLVCFAFMPAPLWYMGSISTDLPFSLLFGFFFIVFFRKENSPGQMRDAYLWVCLLLLMLLTRSNGLSFLLFVIFFFVFSMRDRKELKNPLVMVLIVLLGVVTIGGGILLFPHFQIFVSATQKFSFFGITQQTYLRGGPELPGLINFPLSWLALFTAKIFYFTGIRPSYSGMTWGIVLLRSVSGFILLPGMIYLSWRGTPVHKMLLFFFMLPILLGASQDRYNLPIQPILFYYGVLAANHIFRTIPAKHLRGMIDKLTKGVLGNLATSFWFISPLAKWLHGLRG